MIKINLVVVGRIKESFYREAVAEYVKRLTRFCKTEIKELPERRTLSEEGEDIIKNLKGYVFVLAIEGKKLSSEELAAKIKVLCDEGKEMTFVIGLVVGTERRGEKASGF